MEKKHILLIWFIAMSILYSIALSFEISFLIIAMFLIGSFLSLLLFRPKKYIIENPTPEQKELYKNEKILKDIASSFNISILLFYALFTIGIIISLFFGDNTSSLIAPIILIPILWIFINLYGIDIKFNIKSFFRNTKMGFMPIMLTLVAGIVFGILFYFLKEPITFRTSNLILFGIFIISVAISEEILFRYFVQDLAAKAFKSRAIALQAILFAVLHLEKAVSILLFITLLVFALAAGYLRYKSGLIYSIFLHIITNGILMWLLLF